MERISRGTISKAKRNATHFDLVGHFYRPPMNCHRRLGNVDLERWRLDDIALFGAKAIFGHQRVALSWRGLQGCLEREGKMIQWRLGDAALNHEAVLAPEGAKGDRSPSEVGA